MGHFFSKVSLFIDKKEAAAHLILDQDFATAPFDNYSALVEFDFACGNLNFGCAFKTADFAVSK